MRYTWLPQQATNGTNGSPATTKPAEPKRRAPGSERQCKCGNEHEGQQFDVEGGGEGQPGGQGPLAMDEIGGEQTQHGAQAVGIAVIATHQQRHEAERVRRDGHRGRLRPAPLVPDTARARPQSACGGLIIGSLKMSANGRPKSVRNAQTGPRQIAHQGRMVVQTLRLIQRGDAVLIDERGKPLPGDDIVGARGHGGEPDAGTQSDGGKADEHSRHDGCFPPVAPPQRTVDGHRIAPQERHTRRGARSQRMSNVGGHRAGRSYP